MNPCHPPIESRIQGEAEVPHQAVRLTLPGGRPLGPAQKGYLVTSARICAITIVYPLFPFTLGYYVSGPGNLVVAERSSGRHLVRSRCGVACPAGLARLRNPDQRNDDNHNDRGAIEHVIQP
jgi:hypothetical protein